MSSNALKTADFQEQIRQFYAEKSKDSRSDRYRQQVAIKKRRSDTEKDLERFEKLRDTEIEKLTNDAAETLVLSRKNFEEKQRRSREVVTQASLAIGTVADSMCLTTESPAYLHFKPTTPIKADHILQPQATSAEPVYAQPRTRLSAMPSKPVPQPASSAPAPPTFQSTAATNSATEKQATRIEIEPLPPVGTTRKQPVVELTFRTDASNATPAPVVDDLETTKSFTSRTTDVHSSPTVSFQAQEGNELAEDSLLHKRISFYENEYVRLKAEVAAYESDNKMTEYRLHITRSIREKIDMATKKSSENKDLAKVWSFLNDLMNFKTVVGVDGRPTQISPDDTRTLSYVTWFFCDKYMTLAKLDAELVDSIRLAIIMLTSGSAKVHDIFCALVVGNVTLMRLSSRACVSKVNEIATKPTEFASTWLHNESTMFRLFCRVELGQKPVDATGLVATAKGLPLLHLFLVETLALRTPVPLCSVFVVSEILQTCAKSFKKHQRYSSEYSRVVQQAAALSSFQYDGLDDSLRRSLQGEKAFQMYKARHATLLTLLREALTSELR